VIYSLRLSPKEDQNTLMNFILTFVRSCGSDLITFLLYTFILEMREVVMTIGATSQQDYLLRTMYHLRLKIFVYTTFFVLRFFL
jgi:hypothetical protein